MPLYTLKKGEGVSVAGRTSRKNAHVYAIPLPLALKSELDILVEGGAMSGAILGMLEHGMDVLVERNQMLVVERTQDVHVLLQLGFGISTNERSPGLRDGSHMTHVWAPIEIKERFEKIFVRGTRINALLGLICLSRDVLQATGMRMLVQRPHQP